MQEIDEFVDPVLIGESFHALLPTRLNEYNLFEFFSDPSPLSFLLAPRNYTRAQMNAKREESSLFKRGTLFRLEESEFKGFYVLNMDGYL